LLKTQLREPPLSVSSNKGQVERAQSCSGIKIKGSKCKGEAIPPPVAEIGGGGGVIPPPGVEIWVNVGEEGSPLLLLSKS